MELSKNEYKTTVAIKWNSTSTQQHVYLSKSNEELWNLEQTSPKQWNFAPKQNSQALKTAGVPVQDC